MLAWVCAGARAEVKVLPVEEAFRFGARPLDARTVEVRFTMPDGYYLYRDKLRFAASPALGLAEPALPPGAVKQDPFFGRVETYRREVALRLSLPAGAAGVTVVVEAESQGCADVGICYPPNRQQVTLVLPESAGAPAEFVEAHPPKKRWFK
jgi:thioredoxin:protein disulfide reductase